MTLYQIEGILAERRSAWERFKDWFCGDPSIVEARRANFRKNAEQNRICSLQFFDAFEIIEYGAMDMALWLKQKDIRAGRVFFPADYRGIVRIVCDVRMYISRVVVWDKVLGMKIVNALRKRGVKAVGVPMFADEEGGLGKEVSLKLIYVVDVDLDSVAARAKVVENWLVDVAFIELTNVKESDLMSMEEVTEEE